MFRLLIKCTNLKLIREKYRAILDHWPSLGARTLITFLFYPLGIRERSRRVDTRRLEILEIRTLGHSGVVNTHSVARQQRPSAWKHSDSNRKDPLTGNTMTAHRVLGYRVLNRV